MTRPRIFVQIPSYRDRECQWTLRDMFERARHPERVFAGVCWQTEPAEDEDCFLVRPRQEQVRTADFHISEARGLGWARAQAQALWQGEEYTLQIDSHMRFVDDWDERMIDMLALCGSPDPVLTVYPASYEPPDRRESWSRPQMQTINEFLPSGLLGFGTGVVPEEFPLDRPFATAGLAGGFVFGSSRIITDVPSDPAVYFLGEEPNLAVRLWTAGFDLFSPHQTLLYHYYLRKDGSRHWNDATSRATARLHERTVRRMRLLCEPGAFPPEAQAELAGFGLGTRRSLAEYEAFAGVNFATRTITAAARVYPWVRPADSCAAALPDSLAPAVGTQLFVLGDEGVLFCEATGTLQFLNPAAAITWSALEDGRGWSRIAREMADARGIALDAAWAELRELAAHWISAGVLHDSAVENVHAPRIDPAQFDFRSRYYRLLDSLVQVRFGDAALEQAIHPALAHLEVQRAGSTMTSAMTTVVRILEWHYIVSGGRLLAGPDPLRKLVPRFKAELTARAVRRQDHILHLHAAAVMHAGRLVMLPASSGSGKTLLTARLASLGCRYMSDETVLLLRDGTMQPLATALSVKAGGLALLAPHYPALADLPEHDREDGIAVRYLPPPGWQGVAPTSTQPVIVVFPRYVPGAATALRPLGAAQALGRLLAECLAIPRRLSAASMGTVVEMVERASCWELVSGDLDSAAEQIVALTAH